MHGQQNIKIDTLISKIYSWNEILHVSDSSSFHHQEFFTVHTAMVYVIQFCWQLASRIRMDPDGWNSVPSWSCLQAVSKTVWHIASLCVQWKSLDDERRNCPKHVEFLSKINTFEKLVHLVGFIIRKVRTTHVTPTNALFYNLCVQSFIVAPACFVAIISPTSGSCHQNVFTT